MRIFNRRNPKRELNKYWIKTNVTETNLLHTLINKHTHNNTNKHKLTNFKMSYATLISRMEDLLHVCMFRTLLLNSLALSFVPFLSATVRPNKHHFSSTLSSMLHSY